MGFVIDNHEPPLATSAIFAIWCVFVCFLHFYRFQMTSLLLHQKKIRYEFKTEKSELERLPTEMLWELLSFLEGKDIANANILNKNFHKIVNMVLYDLASHLTKTGWLLENTMR
jgi:hypothetical protein